MGSHPGSSACSKRASGGRHDMLDSLSANNLTVHRTVTSLCALRRELFRWLLGTFIAHRLASKLLSVLRLPRWRGLPIRPRRAAARAGRLRFGRAGTAAARWLRWVAFARVIGDTRHRVAPLHAVATRG